MKETLGDFIFENCCEIISSLMSRLAMLAAANPEVSNDVAEFKKAFDAFRLSVKAKLDKTKEGT